METYTVRAGEHPLSYDERLVAWLDGQEETEAKDVPYIQVSEEQTLIARYARDDEGRVRIATRYEGGVEVSSGIKMAEPLSVATPDWLWRAVLLTKKGVNRG